MLNHVEPHCTNIRSHLVEFVRGSTGRSRESIEHHLAKCDSCREWAQFIQTLDQSFPTYQAGARLGFEKKLERIALEAERQSDIKPRQRRFLVSVIGCAIAVVGILGGVFHPTGDIIAQAFQSGRILLPYITLGTAIILLLASPLLFKSYHNRMEES